MKKRKNNRADWFMDGNMSLESKIIETFLYFNELSFQRGRNWNQRALFLLMKNIPPPLMYNRSTFVYLANLRMCHFFPLSLEQSFPANFKCVSTNLQFKCKLSLSVTRSHSLKLISVKSLQKKKKKKGKQDSG